jgi:hypothetical protein
MDYYSYTYPARVKTETKKIRHIVDTTPEKYKSTYNSRIVGGRPSDQFFFTPTINIPKRQMEYERELTKSYLFPDSEGTGMIKEIHSAIYEPHKFNENGIIREKDNYLLYENKNWTENVRYPIIEYEKINIAKPKPKPKSKPKPKPKPKPKIETKIEREVEVINEEIERDGEKKKKLLKSNYIRKDDRVKNKKIKYKYKKINYDNSNYIRKSDNFESEDNIVNINDCHSSNDDNNINNDSGENGEDNELEYKKIKKSTEQKKITGEFNDLITTKKEYKLHKTSKVISI